MSNEFEMTLCEPAVILPAQLSRGARCDGETSGACALMLAILEDAMLCVARGRRRRHPRTRELAAEADTWMRSDCREWLFSFASICDVLGFDADALRARLLNRADHLASGVSRARVHANGPAPRGAAEARRLPRRGGSRSSIAVDAARAPARRSGGGRGTGAGLGVRAPLGRA